MAELKVAGRYAKSLLDLGVERGAADKLFEDMQRLIAIIKESRPLANFLKNPIIHNYKKITVARALFADKFDALTMAFVELIIKKGREFYLEGIAEAYIKLYNHNKGIRPAKVITAIPVNNAVRQQLLKIVEANVGGTIELEEEVDKEILGGFILRWGDNQIDASVSKQLNDLKREFSRNTVNK